MTIPLRPFFSYYGAKWRLACRYPAPTFDVVKESHAGSACYALHCHDRRVILCDTDPIIAGLWRYLLAVRESEILSLPLQIDAVDELGSKWPQEAGWLVGFWLTRAATMPNRVASLWRRRHRGERRYAQSFWGMEIRQRIACQLASIRHWKIIEGDCEQLANEPATWFVDPPYRGRPGSHYRYGSQRIDYDAISAWCRGLKGQVIVCEALGADWLPFEPLGVSSSTLKRRSREAIWTSQPRPHQLTMPGII